jgi:hypothetical protein
VAGLAARNEIITAVKNTKVRVIKLRFLQPVSCRKWGLKSIAPQFVAGLKWASHAVKISCQPALADGKLWMWKRSPANSAPLLKPTRLIANLTNRSHRNNGWIFLEN